jgi:GT2 family glycosyltransferase
MAGVGTSSTAPRVSVVLATYNRLESLMRLLSCLSKQTLPSDRFEVVVVDDGSTVPVRERLPLVPASFPFSLRIIEQKNAGPAAARHRGVLEARGEILVFVDDDMELPPRFLETHLGYHSSDRPTAVFGRYASDPKIGEKSIFERYHGLKWDELSRAVALGQVRVDGTLLATGNASMRREDYLRVGGFDLSLLRAEDMALGLDLEEIGVSLVFSDAAYSVHLSDHTEPAKWRGRAFLHGKLEPRIARKHPTMAHADPWRFAFSLPLAGRILCLPSVLAPSLGEKLAILAYNAAEGVDKLGFERLAMRGAGLVFGMEYFRGMREEAGSFPRAAAQCLHFLGKAAVADRPLPGVPPWLVGFVTRARHLRLLARRRNRGRF